METSISMKLIKMYLMKKIDVYVHIYLVYIYICITLCVCMYNCYLIKINVSFVLFLCITGYNSC